MCNFSLNGALAIEGAYVQGRRNPEQYVVHSNTHVAMSSLRLFKYTYS